MANGYCQFSQNQRVSPKKNKSSEKNQFVMATKKKKTCDNRFKCSGVNKSTGQLKKGHKYGKGGRIIKVKK